MKSFDPLSFWTAYGAQLDAAGVPRRFEGPEREHEALGAGRAVRWQSRGDVLRIAGRDAPDLLHRIAASEVRDLTPGRGHEVLFTTDKGRVVDLPVLIAGEDDLLALCGRGQAAALADWLQRYVITEDVRIERLKNAHVLTFVTAAHAERGDGWVQAASRAAALDAPTLHSWLQAHVPDRWTLVGEDSYRAWWIERGRLPAGPELASGLNPLEAGLREVVAWTKGCYVGQEVVARLDTYDKVKRQLAVLHADTIWREGQTLQDAAGKTVGKLLAAAPRGDGGGTALVLVDKSVQEGHALRATEATGTVVKVPAAP